MPEPAVAPTLVELSRRGVVRVTGPDAADFLEGLLTISVAGALPRPAALLTPQGKVLHEMHVHAASEAGQGFDLDVAADGAADLVKRLTLFRLRAKLDVADLSATHAAHVAADGSARVIGARGAGPGDVSAFDAWRVADARPEQGPDYGPGEVFPTDVNLDLLGGVDFAKGCFVGQEVVSRMRRRGSVRKRTLVLEADGGAPAKGAAVVAGDVTLGETLSSAAGRTLAVVRLDRLADADPDAIRVEDRPARVRFPAWFPDDARRVGESAS